MLQLRPDPLPMPFIFRVVEKLANSTAQLPETPNREIESSRI